MGPCTIDLTERPAALHIQPDFLSLANYLHGLHRIIVVRIESVRVYFDEPYEAVRFSPDCWKVPELDAEQAETGGKP